MHEIYVLNFHESDRMPTCATLLTLSATFSSLFGNKKTQKKNYSMNCLYFNFAANQITDNARRNIVVKLSKFAKNVNLKNKNNTILTDRIGRVGYDYIESILILFHKFQSVADMQRDFRVTERGGHRRWQTRAT
uniref:Uncharacterized protein n=1 Tax=Romanomermis culicivorax TaxID=13658 RepID=A0A915KXH7_ROMCU